MQIKSKEDIFRYIDKAENKLKEISGGLNNNKVLPSTKDDILEININLQEIIAISSSLNCFTEVSERVLTLADMALRLSACILYLNSLICNKR